ncbi:MAG: hypothetical protein WEA04_03140 [Candidatus Andersenbacteria bacterium]
MRYTLTGQQVTFLILLAVGISIAFLILNTWIFWSWRQVAIRNHNLDVFYKSLTCDDLPLKGDTNVAACEQAIGKFMWQEEGLFTREEPKADDRLKLD